MSRPAISGRVIPAHRALAILGGVFLGVGAYVASALDPLTGLGVLVVGAFLLILPFTSVRDE